MMISTSVWAQPALRLVCALGWTALVLILLLQSSSEPVIGPSAPPGQPTLAREILLTTGHIVGFGLMTALWWWALITLLPARSALTGAIIIALVVGVTTEMAQAALPDRTPSLFDLAVNVVATLATARGIQRLKR